MATQNKGYCGNFSLVKQLKVQDCKKRTYMTAKTDVADAYLLYRTISGSQMSLEGIRSLLMPSYFAGSHDNL